jgi:hypothetical protein
MPTTDFCFRPIRNSLQVGVLTAASGLLVILCGSGSGVDHNVDSQRY